MECWRMMDGGMMRRRGRLLVINRLSSMLNPVDVVSGRWRSSVVAAMTQKRPCLGVVTLAVYFNNVFFAHNVPLYP